MPDVSTTIPAEAPPEVHARARRAPRVPNADPTLGRPVSGDWRGEPRHRLVAIGDSLTQGFQSGAVFATDLSFPAIIARELGWADQFRFPRYGGPGGLPLNLELLLRRLEAGFGSTVSLWETPAAIFGARAFMDEVEDFWERGAGRHAPRLSAYQHALGVYGWDLRDALSRTAAGCATAISAPRDHLINQLVEDHGNRAALRVYPHWDDVRRGMTLFQAAAGLGEERDAGTDCGIETLIVFLGSNNALRTVTELKVAWSGRDFRDLAAKNAYTVWRPTHFAAEFAEVVQAVRGIRARHVIWCTVPHVTIPPVSRGVGGKLAPGSRYFPHYTRPWIADADFDADRDQHITGGQARAVDVAIDLYNETIERAVVAAREGADGPPRDWYLLDVAGFLDRLASRRYIEDPGARPDWWTPYPLPPALAALDPLPTSRFLTSDGRGGRASGGLFSLDGVHPTTVAYGLIAQEAIAIMRRAGVLFRHPTGSLRPDPVSVDFARLIARDTLVEHPPQNLSSTLATLGWADETLDWIRRALPFGG